MASRNTTSNPLSWASAVATVVSGMLRPVRFCRSTNSLICAAVAVTAVRIVLDMPATQLHFCLPIIDDHARSHENCSYRRKPDALGPPSRGEIIVARNIRLGRTGGFRTSPQGRLRSSSMDHCLLTPTSNPATPIDEAACSCFDNLPKAH